MRTHNSKLTFPFYFSSIFEMCGKCRRMASDVPEEFFVVKDARRRQLNRNNDRIGIQLDNYCRHRAHMIIKHK